MDGIYLYKEGAHVILDRFNRYLESAGLKSCMGLMTMELNFRDWDFQDIIMDIKSPALSNSVSLIPKDNAQQASAKVMLPVDRAALCYARTSGTPPRMVTLSWTR